MKSVVPRGQANSMSKVPSHSELREQLRKCGELIDLMASSLNSPIFYHSGQTHYGYRYGKPDARHFCILKSVKMVSCLNACIELADSGFHQELFILIRTFVESDAYIHYVVGDPNEREIQPDQAEFVADFFADYQRNSANDFRRPRISQKKIHDAIGEILDTHVEARDPRTGALTTASALMSNVYLTSSNYVHARYPEIMDMYGGVPGRFHMAGMKNTTKDAESLEAIATYCDSVPIALRMIVMKFEMDEILKDRPDLIAILAF